MVCSSLLLLALSSVLSVTTPGLDGGYSDVIVRIESTVPMLKCSETLTNLKTVLSNSSSSLLSALSGRAYFQSFIIIVPHTWDEDLCQFKDDRDGALASTRVADIIIDEHDGDPHVEHSRGCGVIGDGIFLSVDSLSWLDSDTFARKWIEYRYGVIRTKKDMSPGAGCTSVQQIVRDHPDFTKVVTDNEPHRASMPTIRMVRQPIVKYVLAIETTASMMVGDAWKWVNKAAQKLIRYDIPANSSLAVVSYNNGSKVEHPLERVDDAARERMADTVPGKYQLAGHDVQCLACLFRNILHQVLKGDTAGAHVILVTRGGSDSASVTDKQIISEYIQKYGLKVSTILLPIGNYIPFYDQISETSGGHSFLVKSSSQPMDLYFNIVTSMQRILWPDSSSSALRTQTIHHQEHFSSKNITEGTFNIDKSLGKNTQFGIYVADPEDHLIKSVTFQDEDTGTLYGPYKKMSASYDLINYKTPNIVGEQPFNMKAARRWKYTVEWFPSRKKLSKTILSVTSDGDTSSEQLVVSSWLSRIGWCDTFQHVRIFAKLRRRNMPVLRVRSVMDSVEIDIGNGKGIILSPLEMVDDGEGDTDMIHGDGIYSATILKYPSTGRYSFVIHVDEVEEDTAAKTSPGPVIHLSSIPEEDCVPPARVRDLDISLIAGNRTILATWTSPGGDLDQGSVDRFTAVYSSEMSDLLDEFAEPKVLYILDGKSLAGESLVQEIQFPVSGQSWYIGLYAQDQEGNRGRMSNIQQVFIPEPVTSPPLQVHRLGLPPSTSTDWFLIGIISASIGGLLMIFLLGIIFFLITGKKPKTPSNIQFHSADTPSHPPLNSSPACMQQVTDLQQILAGQRQRVFCPGYSSEKKRLGMSEQAAGYIWEEEDYQSYGQEDSYQDFGHPPSPYGGRGEWGGGRIVTPGLDEGYDSASRELEIIHNQKLYTIV